MLANLIAEMCLCVVDKRNGQFLVLSSKKISFVVWIAI